MSSADFADGAKVSQRVLSFEVEGTVYALPITDVLEVAEQGRLTCIPTLSPCFGGVMNWHGDAIPVVAPAMLFGDPESSDAAAPPSLRSLENGHVLVVSGRRGDSARLGVPIDRVLGLADGPRLAETDHACDSEGIVLERRPVDGRIVNMLDPRRLVARAEEMVGRAVAGTARGARS